MGMSVAACLQDVIVTTYIFHDPEKVFQRVAEAATDEVSSPLTDGVEMTKVSFADSEKVNEEEVILSSSN